MRRRSTTAKTWIVHADLMSSGFDQVDAIGLLCHASTPSPREEAIDDAGLQKGKRAMQYWHVTLRLQWRDELFLPGTRKEEEEEMKRGKCCDQ